MSEISGFKYDAFISYRHSELDKAIAEKLHRMLESFKVPQSIVKKGSQKKVGRVFRDRDELPTSPNLAENIRKALASSEHLIVICSPRTPESEWVAKEIETFAALHGHDHILALLIEGEPSQSFPEPLRFIPHRTLLEDGTYLETRMEVEPLAADIRGSNIKEMKKKLKTEILRLLAPILNCRFDDLKQRHRERAIRRALTFSISLSLFFAAFGSFSAYQAYLIQQQSNLVKLQVQKTLQGQSLYMSDIASRLLMDGDRQTAVLVAREALPENLNNPDRPYMAEAEFALGEALRVYQFDNRLVADVALKHSKNVNSMALSPDAKILVTNAQDGFLYFWETAHGNLIHKLQVGENYIEKGQLYFVDNETLIYKGSCQNAIVCLDISDFKEKWRYETYSTKFAINSDHSKLAILSDEVVVIDTSNGQALYKYSLAEYLDDENGTVYQNCITFDLSGNLLGIGLSNGRALVIRLDEKNIVGVYNSPYESVKEITFSTDQKVAIASSFSDPDNMSFFSNGKGALTVYNLLDQYKLLEMHFDYAAIDNLAFIPNDPNQLVMTEGEKINIVSLDEAKILYTFICGDSASDYLIGDEMIASVSYDGTLRFWLMKNEGYEYEPHRITLSGDLSEIQRSQDVFCVSSAASNRVYILRYLENPSIQRFEGHDDSVQDFQISHDGRRMLTSTFMKGQLYLWDTSTHQVIGRLTNQSDTYSLACFIENDHKILTSANKTLTVYDAQTLEPTASHSMDFEINKKNLNQDLSLCLIPDSDQYKIIRTTDLSEISTLDEMLYIEELAYINHNAQLVLSGSSKTAVYDVKTGHQLRELPYDQVDAMAVSPDGKILAIACSDRTIHLLDTTDLHEKRTIGSYDLKIGKMTFDPSGKTLYIGLEDFTIQCMDLTTGNLIAELKGNTSILDQVLFNQHQSLFITVGRSKDAVIWRQGTMKKIGQTKEFMGISPDFSALYCRQYQNIIQLPFYNTQMLLDECNRQLEGKTLTDKEKQDLFIIE